MVDVCTQWRLFVRSILEPFPAFQVIGGASDGIDAIKKAASLLPDAILLDVGMPLLNGIEAAERIRELCPDATLIFLNRSMIARSEERRWTPGQQHIS